MSRLRSVLLLVALAVVAAACGSSATENTSSTVVPSTSLVPGVSGQVTVGDSVSVHYIGTLDSGEEFDASRNRGATLDFVAGVGRMIPGFDAAVLGMDVGDVKTVRLVPTEAYGERDAGLVIELPIEDFPAGVAVGDRLSSGGGPVVVTAVTADTVTIDTNHELAGQFLTFEIELVSING